MDWWFWRHAPLGVGELQRCCAPFLISEHHVKLTLTNFRRLENKHHWALVNTTRIEQPPIPGPFLFDPASITLSDGLNVVDDPVAGLRVLLLVSLQPAVWSGGDAVLSLFRSLYNYHVSDVPFNFIAHALAMLAQFVCVENSSPHNATCTTRRKEITTHLGELLARLINPHHPSVTHRVFVLSYDASTLQPEELANQVHALKELLPGLRGHTQTHTYTYTHTHTHTHMLI
jgi:hypothetical protein